MRNYLHITYIHAVNDSREILRNRMDATWGKSNFVYIPEMKQNKNQN